MLFITMSVMCAIMRAGGSLARDVASNDARPFEGGYVLFDSSGKGARQTFPQPRGDG